MSKKQNRNKTITNSAIKKIFYIDNSPVFKFINPNSNDKLSTMNGFDLQELIILIDDYYLQVRSQLGFEQYITFGLELEFENAIRKQIDKQLKEAFSNDNWKTKHDGSLKNGAEISSPILRDTTINWKNLIKVCSIVEPLASIDINSGGHIHVGTQTLGDNSQSWLNFIKIWSVYENIIFRFAYGNFLTARPNILCYAEPMAKDFWNDYKSLKDNHSSLESIISTISHQRCQAVNFKNVSKKNCNDFYTNNTIEFRCPNGSLDPAIWQNNVNLFVNILLYSKSSNYDDNVIQNRRNINEDKFSDLKWYNEIYLQQALEFCDLIFSNNFDKVYFLRQYLKSFQVCNTHNNYPKARTLTKKGFKSIN